MEAWEEGARDNRCEVIGAGSRVLVIACFQGRGRGSGVRVEQRLYEVYALRNGSILRVDEFSDRDRALEAVGLRDQAMSLPVQVTG